MINYIHQIARLITECPDILLESLEKSIKKLLIKISDQLPHEIDIDEIAQFATQQRFKEAGVSRWIAKQVAFNPNLKVDWTLLIDYIDYLKFRDNDKYKTILQKKIQEVVKDAEKWHSRSKDNDEPIIVEFPNGYKIVKLITGEHLEIEGKAMGHCVGNYSVKRGDFYSFRSPDGKPKATIYIIKDGRVQEIKGRQNKSPVKKYSKLITQWLNTLLNDPSKLFVDPEVNFAEYGFEDYLNSLHDKSLLRKLAKNDNARIRMAVARSYQTPTDILESLGKDGDYQVREAVATNSRTPIEMLKLLAKDDHRKVRESIATNPKSPIEILRLLAKDDDMHIKMLMAENFDTPPEILRILSKDENYHVRYWVAFNHSTPSDILRTLSKNEDEAIRALVAFNKNASTNVLKILSKDKSWNVRVKVARNSITPINILRYLANDDNEEVKYWAADNLSKRD